MTIRAEAKVRGWCDGCGDTRRRYLTAQGVRSTGCVCKAPDTEYAEITDELHDARLDANLAWRTFSEAMKRLADAEHREVSVAETWWVPTDE